MSELKGPVIVVDDNTEATHNLLAIFQSAGWDCLTASNLDNLQDICIDPLNQPVILTAQYLQNQNVDNQFITGLFGYYLAVIALDERSAGSEAYYFRLCVSDILEPNHIERDIPEVLKRLAKLA